MSEALERVIAEQQKEIDRLRSLQQSNREAWEREYKLHDAMVMAAFSVLSYPESPECHWDLKKALLAYGYCPRCELIHCECQEDD